MREIGAHRSVGALPGPTGVTIQGAGLQAGGIPIVTPNGRPRQLDWMTPTPIMAFTYPTPPDPF